jgi:hypothetical protein
VSRKPALALMALALLALAGPALIRPGRAAAAQQRPAAGSQPDCVIPVPILCPSPSPSPTPTPSGGRSPDPAPTPSASASADPTPSSGGSASASASPSPSGPATASPRPRRSGRAKASSVKAAAPSGLMVSEAQFVLSSGSALLLGASYQGVAQVPTASGQTVPMMKFTMTSLTLRGSPTLTVTQSGVTSQASGTSMQFTGNVVLYATQLSGDLLGVPVTLTPSSPLATILQLLNSVTPLVPLKLTNVTSAQPYISANSLQLPGLSETG